MPEYTDADVDLLGRAFAEATGDPCSHSHPCPWLERDRAAARLMLDALVAAGWHRVCPDAAPTLQYKARATVTTVGAAGAVGPTATMYTEPAPTRSAAVGPLPFGVTDVSVFRRSVWNLPDGGRYEGPWVEDGDRRGD